MPAQEKNSKIEENKGHAERGAQDTGLKEEPIRGEFRSSEVFFSSLFESNGKNFLRSGSLTEHKIR